MAEQHSRIVFSDDFCYPVLAVKDFEASPCSSPTGTQRNSTLFALKVGVHAPTFLGPCFVFVTLKAHFVFIVFVSNQSMLNTRNFRGVCRHPLDVKQIETARMLDWVVFIASPRPS